MKRILFILLFIVGLAGCGGGGGQKVDYQFVGQSMSPTIEDQQKVVVDKDFYKKNKIKRDDLVLYNLTADQQHIKRVVGLPNEWIQIKQGMIYIDGEPLKSEYDFTDITSEENEFKLKEDEYFILGDNHGQSVDSRSKGPVAKEDILGKVLEIKEE